jgi:hypothetical protein
MSGIRSVYVIGGEGGPQKIGISANVPQRLEALQYSVPQALRAHHQVRPPGDARMVETMWLVERLEHEAAA